MRLGLEFFNLFDHRLGKVVCGLIVHTGIDHDHGADTDRVSAGIRPFVFARLDLAGCASKGGSYLGSDISRDVEKDWLDALCNFSDTRVIKSNTEIG